MGYYIGFTKPLDQDLMEQTAPYPKDTSSQRSYKSVSNFFFNSRKSKFGNQGYRALKNFSITPLRRSINTPSYVSQMMISYTQPIQYFPPGKVTQLSTPENKKNITSWVNKQFPSVKLPAPLQSIPTRMPWSR